MSTTTRCGKCQFYAELKEPFQFKMNGYPTDVIVYGFCAKNVNSAVVSFYPVYLPDGGVCTQYQPRRTNNEKNDLR